MALTPRIAVGLCFLAAAQWGIAASPGAPSTAPSAAPPEIPLLEPGLWIFEIETRREGQPVEKRTIRDCVDFRGLYSADRPQECARNSATRSADGKSLLVELECRVEPQVARYARLTEAEGRGPLDLRELGARISSRSVFTGDLRKAYRRENRTSVEWPLGETQVTQSVTVGRWQGAACPEDLPPDDLMRWVTMPRAPAEENPPAIKGEPVTQPVMHPGLWRTRITTTVDDAASTVTDKTRCQRGMPGGKGRSIPEGLALNVCTGRDDIRIEMQASDIVMTTRCEVPPMHIMRADLDFVRPSLIVRSRSDFRGDFSRRFQVRHDTEVRYPSGRVSKILSVNELERVGDCPADAEEGS
jgi:hypothetical protein